MTNESRNVDLVIRAKNLSKKTLEEVSHQIAEINKAIDEQVDASKRGEGSLKALNATYGELEKAMASLAKQQALVNQFESQTTQLETLQKALGDASKKLREYETELGNTEKVTKRQEQTQTRLTSAVTRAEVALTKQVERLAKTRTEAESLGLSMSDLGGTQDRLANTGRALATANTKLTVGLENFESNTRDAARAAKELAATQAFEKTAADAAKLNKAGEYVRFWTTELDKLDVAEKTQRDTDTFMRKSRDAANLVKAAEYADFWVKALDKVDKAERQLADNKSLNDAADRAVAAARGYTTLGNATRKLVQNSKPLADQLRSIADPSADVRSSLSGVEETITALAGAISKIKGPVTDYKNQLKQLSDAQKTLASQADGIDAYQRQVVALRNARTEFSAARAELLQFASATRAAGTPTNEMVVTQKRLEAALAATSAQLQVEVGKTRELRDGLNSAGISTNNLAGAQDRLLNAARTSKGALTDLQAAATKYGTEVDNASKKTSFFESNGRTTLSFMQRLRGEILALAAAYVGLQGSIDLAKGSIEATNTKQGLLNQLALSVGDDPKAIANEYKYIREQSDRIGISFEEAAKGYAKFAAAAKLAGRGTKEIHYVAEAFLEVGRVANLTNDDIGGVFKALEQIYSKGKVQAEELRGQLGDRLFGAFEIAALALKDQFPDLDKAMKDGLITSEQLLAIAEKYRQTVANRLPTAMESLASNQARLNSVFFDFKVLIADSGFADAYGQLVLKLSAFFRSDDGTKFAQGLSSAFAAVVTVLSFLVDNLDGIKLAVELAFGITAAKLIFGFAAAIKLGVANVIALNASLTATAGLVGLVQKAFLALAAFFVGWEIGTYLSEKFEVVRQVAIALVIGLEKGFTQIGFAANVVWTGIATGATNSFNQALNKFQDLKDGFLKILSDLARAAKQEDLADSLLGKISDGTRRELTDVTTEIDRLKAKLDKDIKQIDDIGFEMFQDASDASRNKPKAKAAPIEATPKPDIPITPVAAKPDKAYERLVKQRIALAAQLVDALAAAETKISRNEKLSLADRLKAIDTEYQKVFLKIDKLSKLPGGAPIAAEMRKTLTGYVEQLKVQETLKFNTEEMARREKAINDLLALRAQLLQTIAAQQKGGLITPQQAKEATAGVDEKLNPQIEAAVTSAEAFAKANSKVFDNQEAMDTYISKLQAIRAGLITVNTDLLTTAQANEMLASGLTGAFDGFAQAIANGENALDAFKTAFLNFAADFLKQIALMILKQIILNALQNSSIGGAVAGAVSGAVKAHSGAVVGSGGRGGTKLNVGSGYFNNAPKYHTGGIVGLAADEYPAILKRNEEVLADDNPRNILNGGAGANGADGGTGGSSGAQQDIRINNYIDSVSVLDAALATPAGTKLIMNVLQANRSGLKSLVR